jgi:hypothetical protein
MDDWCIAGGASLDEALLKGAERKLCCVRRVTDCMTAKINVWMTIRGRSKTLLSQYRTARWYYLASACVLPTPSLSIECANTPVYEIGSRVYNGIRTSDLINIRYSVLEAGKY